MGSEGSGWVWDSSSWVSDSAPYEVAEGINPVEVGGGSDDAGCDPI